MSKIVCPCAECIHNGNNFICSAKKVEFIFRNMATVNEGRVDMWVCKQYELSEHSKQVKAAIEEIIKEIDQEIR